MDGLTARPAYGLWLDRNIKHAEVPHAFFHHMQAVEKVQFMTQKAARHDCPLGLAHSRRARAVVRAQIVS
jgi:hypothetical protein